MADPLEIRLREHIKNNHLPDIRNKMLVAVSGGNDSVALLLLLNALGYMCYGAHCNFGLRGSESDCDCEFVKHLFADLHLPLEVKRFDITAYRQTHRGTSIEMACREVRYQWFEQLRQRYSLDYIAVAHHSDDNIETFLLNATRGTGLNGLTAMRQVNDNHVFRPLLKFSRKDLSEYLIRKGQDFVYDHTNSENIFRRNAIRNNAIPALRQANPAAETGLTKTIENLSQANALYLEMIDNVEKQISTDYGYDLKGLLAYNHCSTLLFEVLRKHGFTKDQCDDIICILRGSWNGSKFFYGKNCCAELKRDGSLYFIVKNDREVYKLSLEDLTCNSQSIIKIQYIYNQPFSPSMVDGYNRIAISAEAATHDLIIRHWRHGDRISPYGMKGSRLLSDIYSDHHLSISDKKMQWVVEDTTTGSILWAIGYRASKHFIVPENSTDYFLFSTIGAERNY